MATVAELTSRLDAALKRQPVGAHSLKVDLGGDGVIRAENDSATLGDAPADCTLRLSKDDLERMLAGALDPRAAMMDGRLQLEGDVMVAVTLQPVILAAWSGAAG